MEYDTGYLVTPIIAGCRIIPEENRVTEFIPLEEMGDYSEACHKAKIIYEMKPVGDWLNGEQ